MITGIMDGAQVPGPGVQGLSTHPQGREKAVHVRLPLPTWASSELRAAAPLQVTAVSCHHSPAQAS